MKTPSRNWVKALKTLFHLALLVASFGTLLSCSVGYIDRARFKTLTPYETRDDLKISLAADTRGIYWHRDDGRATLYITAKAEDEPIVSAIYWRTGEEWHEVKTAKARSSWQQAGPSWYLTIPLGFLFISTEPTDVELRVHVRHRGRQEVVAQRYRAVRDQKWHKFNLFLDVT